jgi:hypothetical protein
LKTQAHHATGDIEPGAAFDTEPMVILAVSAWLSKTHAARFLGFWDAAAHDQSELLINNEEKQRDIERAWARYPAYPAAFYDGQYAHGVRRRSAARSPRKSTCEQSLPGGSTR